MADDITIEGDNVIVQQTYPKNDYRNAKIAELETLQAHRADLDARITELQNLIDSLA